MSPRDSLPPSPSSHLPFFSSSVFKLIELDSEAGMKHGLVQPFFPPSIPPSLPRHPDGVSSTPSAPCEVNEENDKSGVEYELVQHVPEEEGEEEIWNEEGLVEEI